MNVLRRPFKTQPQAAISTVANERPLLSSEVHRQLGKLMFYR